MSSHGPQSRAAADRARKRRFSLADVLGHLGFFGAASLIAALGWVLFTETARTVAISDQVERSEATLKALRAFEEHERQVTSSFREYLLSGDAARLSARDAALQALNRQYQQLAELAADEPQLRRWVDVLSQAVSARIAVMQDAQESASSGGVAAARQIEASERAAAAARQLESLLREGHAEQQRILDERRENERRRYRELRGMLLTIVFLAVLVLLPGYLGFVVQSRARARAEAKLLDMANSVPGVIYQVRIDRDGRSRFEFLGEGVAALRGVGREAALRDAEQVWATVLPEDRPALDAAGRQAAQALAPIEHDFRVQMPDGSIRWLHTSGSHRREPDGSVMRTGYWSDITPNKQLEEQLREAKQRLSDVAEELPGIVYQFYRSPAGAVGMRFISGATQALLGVEREVLQRDPDLALAKVVPEDWEAIRGPIEQSAAALTPFQQEFRVLREGQLRWHTVNAVPRRLPDGTVVWTGYWSDVTERKALEESLHQTKEAAEAANRAKSAFLATMSHEIRTPMNAVLGMLELLAGTSLDDEQRHMIELVRESGRSLQSLIDDILDFSKIEAGRVEIRPEPTSIRMLLESIDTLYSGAANGKGLLLVHSLDPNVGPAVRVDGLRLRQIIANLVSNAIKFTEHGRVELTVSLLERTATTEKIRFSVRDTGIGIAPDDQARLFQPFTQAAHRVESKFGGTGLGLAISRGLAELMGGTLALESEPGRGTTVSLTLTLPIADAKELAVPVTKAKAQAVTQARPPPSIEDAERQGTLVLIADDHPTNRLVLRTQVNALGYAALTAEHGLEALRLLRAHRTGLLIADCNMPEMNGYDLARNIREREALEGGRRLPIIACTANALAGQAEACFAAGMDDYLVKPASLAQLRRKMELWLPLTTGGTGAPSADAPATTGAPPAVDRSVLGLVSGGRPEREQQILQDYVRLTTTDVATLEGAMGRRDTEAVLGSSHRVLGASRMLGVAGVARACAALEAAVRGGDWPAATGCLRDLGAEVDRVRMEIQKPVAGARPPPTEIVGQGTVQ